jgi:hypothetical protein
MISFTGEFLKKGFVEDQMVSVEDLAKMSGIEIPKGKAYFELNPDKASKSQLGDPRFVETITRKMIIDGYMKDAPVRIVHYQSRVGKKGEYKYNGVRVRLFNKQKVRTVDTSSPAGRELYLMMMLHPHCQQSPFYDKRYSWLWTAVDYQERSKKASLDMEAKHAAQTAIFATSNPLLIAKGIQVGSRGVAANDDSTAKLELIKLLDAVGTERFDAAWNDPTTTLRGVARMSTENGLVSVQNRGGMKLLKYGDNEIFEIPPSKDTEIEFMNYLRKNPEFYEELYNKLK